MKDKRQNSDLIGYIFLLSNYKMIKSLNIDLNGK